MGDHDVEADAFVGQDTHPEAEGCEGTEDLGAHEVSKGQSALGSAQHKGAPLAELGDGLTRQVVEGKQAARVGVRGQGLVQERAERLIGDAPGARWRSRTPGTPTPRR